MKWVAVGLALGTMAVFLVGCSDAVSAPASDDLALSALEQRTLGLKASVGQTGRLTTEQRLELTGLSSDISAWRARTGRTDIAVSSSEAARNTTSFAGASVGPGVCSACPPVTASGGKICFLAEEGACDTSGGLTMKVCAYFCITLDPGGTPIRRR